jgi:hypothetical protein
LVRSGLNIRQGQPRAEASTNYKRYLPCIIGHRARARRRQCERQQFLTCAITGPIAPVETVALDNGNRLVPYKCPTCLRVTVYSRRRHISHCCSLRDRSAEFQQLTVESKPPGEPSSKMYQPIPPDEEIRDIPLCHCPNIRNQAGK